MAVVTAWKTDPDFRPGREEWPRLPHVELLRQCVRPQPDERLLTSLAGQALDWEKLLQQATLHGTRSLLYSRLNAACPAAVPPRVLARLQEAFHTNTRRTLILAAQLAQILRAFDDASIPVIPFKGPVLAWSVYPSPVLRESSDLDLLVRRQHFRPARELLSQLGYRHAAAELSDAFMEWNEELPLTSPDAHLHVDLHWTPVPRYILTIDPEYFWSGLAPVTVAGRRVWAFSPEKTFLYLCLHGCKHAWKSLKWVCDLAHVAHAQSLDWDWIVSEAMSRRIGRQVSLGWCLARDLLGASCPEPADVTAIRHSRSYRQARSHLLSNWPGESRLREMLFQFPLVEPVHDKWRLCRGWFEPTPLDLAAVHLPAAFSGLYYPLRAIRVVRDRLAGYASLPKEQKQS